MMSDPTETMSAREKLIREGFRFDSERDAEAAWYLLGLIDVIRADRDRMRDVYAERDKAQALVADLHTVLIRVRREREHLSSLLDAAALGKTAAEHEITALCAERDALDVKCAGRLEMLKSCAKMLRRGQKACERQGWEKGESSEAWYHAAGQLAGLIEMHAKE